MPKVSKRAKFARALRHRILLSLLEETWYASDPSTLEELEADIEESLDLLACVVSTRYLAPRTQGTPKHCGFVTFLLNEMSDGAFRQQLRMNRASFAAVVDLIKGDPVFHPVGKKPQKPVAYQAAVVFNRLGTHGNGTSIGAIVQKFGISTGSVAAYTERVLTALVNKARDYIVWPNDEERAQIARRVGNKYGFPGCVGFVDGTHFIFAQKPGVDGQTYFTMKQRYALNGQVVCDDKKRIRYLQSGLPGSAHDSRAWSDTKVVKYPGFFFSEGQYLMADSAYALSRSCMKPYTEPAANQPQNRRFNYLFSKARVAVEHTIGLLKNRWASLKGLPHQVQSLNGLEAVNRWIAACAVLHNILMSAAIDDEWDDAQLDEDENDDNWMNGPQLQEYNMNVAAQFRQAVQKHVLEWDKNR